MKNIINWIGTKILSKRIERIHEFRKHPFKAQEKVFSYLIENASQTSWGNKNRVD